MSNKAKILFILAALFFAPVMYTLVMMWFGIPPVQPRVEANFFFFVVALTCLTSGIILIASES